MGKSLGDLDLPNGIEICIIIRREDIIIPQEDTMLFSDDTLIILCKVEKLKKVEKFFSDKVKYF